MGAGKLGGERLKKQGKMLGMTQQSTSVIWGGG